MKPTKPISEHDLDWEELRTFLVMARLGSANSAAEHLQVAHTTVGRRLNALEAKIGLQLFERRPGGSLKLSGAGEIAFEEITRMDEGANSLLRRLKADKIEAVGEVRINITEGFATLWLVPAMRKFQSAHSSLRLNWLTTNTNYLEVGKDTDLALWWHAPTQSSLVRRKLGVVRYSLYCTQAYLDHFGIPSNLDDLASHRLLQFNGYDKNPDLKPWNDLLKRFPPATRIESSLSAVNIMGGASYITLLPDYVVGSTELELLKLDIPIDISLTCWLVYHEDQRRSAPIRSVADEIISQAASARGTWLYV